jgi:DNA replication protein DnaC
MEQLINLSTQIPEHTTALECEDWEQYKVDTYNKREGDLTGYDCDICKNKGDIAFVKDGVMTLKDCQCSKPRRSLKLIQKSGLSGILDDYTFDKYKIKEEWQKKVKASAEKFLTDNEGKWFYIGGISGSGKTHICTAIVGNLLKQGYPSRYMLWRDEVVKLKGLVNYPEEYQEAIHPFKTVKVLYIDDFLKTKKGDKATGGDINIAFEILNNRYVNKNLITIISSELSVEEVMNIDMAVGGRVYQRTKEYAIDVGNDKARNRRLNNG